MKRLVSSIFSLHWFGSQETNQAILFPYHHYRSSCLSSVVSHIHFKPCYWDVVPRIETKNQMRRMIDRWSIIGRNLDGVPKKPVYLAVK